MQTLVIDSHIEIVQRLKELILESGVSEHVHTALSITDTFNIINTVRPEAIVLDINLPANQSFDILTEIRKNYPGTLVIALSIHIDTQTKNKCLSLGADYFFDKYCEFDKIPDVLKLRNEHN